NGQMFLEGRCTLTLQSEKRGLSLPFVIEMSERRHVLDRELVAMNEISPTDAAAGRERVPKARNSRWQAM
ncbi:hypothetical protein BHE74_00059810, partial [Ensete ventricosum]